MVIVNFYLSLKLSTGNLGPHVPNSSEAQATCWCLPHSYFFFFTGLPFQVLIIQPGAIFLTLFFVSSLNKFFFALALMKLQISPLTILINLTLTYTSSLVKSQTPTKDQYSYLCSLSPCWMNSYFGLDESPTGFKYAPIFTRFVFLSV